MERELGVPVQVVNKPGASTQVALAELAGAPPDGYNIGFMAISTSLITYLDTTRKATYGRDDFQPVATYTTEPNALVVKADSPFKSLQDVLDAAKARPGEVTVATPSLNGSSHLPMLILEKMTGTKFKYVHFDGGAPVISALLGGHVQVASAAASQFLALSKSGEVRMLGMMDTERSRFYPDTPTLPELGFDLSAPSTYGLIVPAGTPMEVVNTLSEAIKKSMDDPSVQSKLADFGLATRYRNPEEFARFWDEQENHVKEALELAKG
jgi:tripartite-type tricarboxylate transporter receptor subunit TctC